MSANHKSSEEEALEMALERWVGICPVENESVNEERSKQRKFHVLNPEIGMYMLC